MECKCKRERFQVLWEDVHRGDVVPFSRRSDGERAVAEWRMSIRGTVMDSDCADLRPALLYAVSVGTTSSARWDGASEYKHWWTSMHSLYNTRCLMGSQWRCLAMVWHDNDVMNWKRVAQQRWALTTDVEDHGLEGPRTRRYTRPVHCARDRWHNFYIVWSKCLHPART